MEVVSEGEITIESGLIGDFKGAKHKTRQITIMAEEDWAVSLAVLGSSVDEYPWTIRRANLLTRGLRLPRVKGALISVGSIDLEVTGQTYPCKRMDEALEGLRKALTPDWRGGVTCTVIAGGKLCLSDEVSISFAPEETVRRLPG